MTRDVAKRLEAVEEEVARLWQRLSTSSGLDMGTKEAAEYLNMSERWVQLHAEKLGGVMVGSRLQFAKADLDRYIESRELEP